MIDEQDFNNWRGEIDDALHMVREDMKKLALRLEQLEKAILEKSM